MYTIKQASIRSGVPVALLRAWERRYAVVAPVRTAGGYRLYDDAAIARLAAMRRMVDEGWTPSQAADEVVRLGDAPPWPAPPAELAPGAAPSSPDRVETRDLLLVSAARYDTAGIERALDRILAMGSYEAVIDDLLLPAVAALGAGWAAGTLDIAAEHLASEAVQRRLAVLFDGSSVAGTGQPVVVGLPPGNLHEIGAMAFAVALRRRGLDVLYLGPDVPVASWVHAATAVRAKAAVVGVTREADVLEARVVAEALLDANPSLVVAIGGPAALAARVGVGIALAPRVADASQDLAERLAGRRS